MRKARIILVVGAGFQPDLCARAIRLAAGDSRPHHPERPPRPVHFVSGVCTSCKIPWMGNLIHSGRLLSS